MISDASIAKGQDAPLPNHTPHELRNGYQSHPLPPYDPSLFYVSPEADSATSAFPTVTRYPFTGQDLLNLIFSFSDGFQDGSIKNKDELSFLLGDEENRRKLSAHKSIYPPNQTFSTGGFFLRLIDMDNMYKEKRDYSITLPIDMISLNKVILSDQPQDGGFRRYYRMQAYREYCYTPNDISKIMTSKKINLEENNFFERSRNIGSMYASSGWIFTPSRKTQRYSSKNYSLKISYFYFNSIAANSENSFDNNACAMNFEFIER